MRLTFDCSLLTRIKMVAAIAAIGLGLVILSVSYVCMLCLIAEHSGADTLLDAQKDLFKGLKDI